MLPPNPDTPPIDRSVTTIVMCVELILAFLVATSCVVFSVYFIATRPPEGSIASSAPATSAARRLESAVSSEEETPEQLTESLLHEEQTQDDEKDEGSAEYGSFLRRSNRFISSLSPWRQSS